MESNCKLRVRIESIAGLRLSGLCLFLKRQSGKILPMLYAYLLMFITGKAQGWHLFANSRYGTGGEGTLRGREERERSDTNFFKLLDFMYCVNLLLQRYKGTLWIVIHCKLEQTNKQTNKPKSLPASISAPWPRILSMWEFTRVRLSWWFIALKTIHF